jgi:hypothetical protein
MEPSSSAASFHPFWEIYATFLVGSWNSATQTVQTQDRGRFTTRGLALARELLATKITPPTPESIGAKQYMDQWEASGILTTLHALPRQFPTAGIVIQPTEGVQVSIKPSSSSSSSSPQIVVSGPHDTSLILKVEYASSPADAKSATTTTATVKQFDIISVSGTAEQILYLLQSLLVATQFDLECKRCIEALTQQKRIVFALSVRQKKCFCVSDWFT